MTARDREAGSALAIRGLSSIVVELLARASQPLLPRGQGQLGLFLRYLRRKPGRGLAVTYHVDTPTTSRRMRRGAHKRWVSLTLGEAALARLQGRFAAGQAQQAALEVHPAGILRVPDPDLRLQVFPADSGLPALAASCTTARDGALFPALEAAARVQLGDPAWHLVAARAEPVRYKPSSRCVIRYDLVLARAVTGGALRRRLSLFGKVYGDPEQARRIQVTTQQLYAEQSKTGEPVLPRPLGAVEALGLVLNEAIQSPDGTGPETLRPGVRALRPRFLRRGDGGILDVIIPGEELRLTAHALARLHTSAARPVGSPYTGAEAAKGACERAALIAAQNPAHAYEAQRLAQQLATRLAVLQPACRPAHGGFKASQLLFRAQRVFIVDFDGFRLADPALDVGYFLAYLRPSGLWYDRPGMRRWFERSAASFLSAYRQALCEYGIDEATADGIVRRRHLYEAAVLFKIATRRVHRLNSPRPGEVSAMLAEIAQCLADAPRSSSPEVHDATIAAGSGV